MGKRKVLCAVMLTICLNIVVADTRIPEEYSVVDSDEELYSVAQTSAGNQYGNTPLHEIAFAEHGFAEMLELFVAARVDLNAKNSRGDNLILLSILGGKSKQELELLLDYGVSWNVTNDKGHTPLHYAAAAGNLEDLKLFASLGADIEVKDDTGCTPFLRIAEAKENFPEILSWFADQGANIHAVDNDGDNLAIIAAMQERSVYELKQIVELGVDWKYSNKKGQTVLHYAASSGKLKALKFFKSLGADINAQDVYEKTPLLRIFESDENSLEMLAWFAKEGADLNVVDENGNNLIFLAIATERTVSEITQIVEAGVNWKVKNNKKQTVLHYATAYGNLEAMMYFRSLGADINAKDIFGRAAIHRILEAGMHFDEMLNWFIKEGANLNAVDEEGDNLVMYLTMKRGTEKQLKKIIKLGVNWEVKNEKGLSVMHYAAMFGNLEALKYFESLGADIGERSKAGVTPVIMGAHAERNFLEVLAWFVQEGADLHAVDIDGENLVLTAVKAGRSVKELEQILKLGVSWNIRNKNKQSVLHLAVSAGNVEALKYFKALKAKESNQKTRPNDEL